MKAAVVMVALLLLASAYASETETDVDALNEVDEGVESKGSVVLHDQLSSASMKKVENLLDESSFSQNPAPSIPQARPALVMPAGQPLLPGCDMVGMGIDLRGGLEVNSMTRPLLVMTSVDPLAVDSTLTYSIPSWQVGRRNFRADITTKVFNSVSDKMKDIAVSAGVEFGAGMFSGSAEAKVQITSNEKQTTFITSASMDVQFFDLAAVKFQASDVDPRLMQDFLALPIMWTDNPLQLHNFVTRWGTHYVKSVKIGGTFEMIGTTTTSDSMDSLSVAANVKMEFTGKVKIAAKGDVNYKDSSKNSKMSSQFDFHARGGDPAIGGMLAHIQSTKGDVAPAMEKWLQSLKLTPTVHGLRVGFIHEIFYTMSGLATEQRIQAIKQAIDVYMKEKDPNANVINVGPGKPIFSNFWRIGDQCLSYQATVGHDSEFQVYLTASASRDEVAYKFISDSYGTRLMKGSEMVAKNQDFGAITPGSTVLYSSYIICYDSKKGNLLFGRGNRVEFAYKDPNPNPAYFYGFKTVYKGNLDKTNLQYMKQAYVSLTAVQLYSLDDLNCPIALGDTCGGPARGSCLSTKMCQCSPQYRGFACQHDCPVDNSSNVCSNNGVCTLPAVTNYGAKPFCQCKSGFLGQRCGIAEIPTVQVSAEPVVNGTTMLFSGKQTNLHMELFAKDLRALKYPPTSWEYAIKDEDHFEPVIIKGQNTVIRAVPGSITLTATVTFPHNPDKAVFTNVAQVADCVCSNKGTCDANAKCQCDASAAGPLCEFDIVSGFAKVGKSSAENFHKYVYMRYARPLADKATNIQFTPYQSNMILNFTVITSTSKGAYIKVTRQDKFEAWTENLRVLYKVTGLRYVQPQIGVKRVGPAREKTPVYAAIRFPTPYKEAPFLYVKTANQASYGPEEFGYKIVKLTSSNAIVQVYRTDDGKTPYDKWMTDVSMFWLTRPYPEQDYYQKDCSRWAPPTRVPSSSKSCTPTYTAPTRR